jgi:tetratricopeptide (TPR) repeat protein
LPISETTFVRRDGPAKYEFVRNTASAGSGNGDGAVATSVEAVVISANGGSLNAKKITADTLVPFEMLISGKISEAIDGYRKIKQATPAHPTVSEDRLNNLGYNLLRQKKLPEALALLKLNVEFYPNAWNTYDSLAEAYMTNGDKELAVANYKKSLELNPQNTSGREMLKKLEGK